MKNHLIKTAIVLLTLVAGGLGLSAQTVNKLTVPDIEGERGEQIVVPVYLDNTDEITALEFTLSLPSYYGESTQGELKLSSRATDHVITYNNSGKVLVYSPTSSPLRGNSGQILTVSTTVPSWLDGETEYPISLYDVVLATADGSDVATSWSSGYLKIKTGPDFTPSNLTTDRMAYAPGETVTLNYTVENIGGAPNIGGWSEEAYIAYPDGTKSIYIGGEYRSEVIPAHSSIERSMTLQLPTELPLDGEVALMIKLVPGGEHGEGPEKQDNNTVWSSSVNLSKGLRIECYDLYEGSTYPAAFTLYRSGDLSEAEIVSIMIENAPDCMMVPIFEELTYESTVFIPAGQYAGTFYVTPIDNDVPEGRYQFIITAENGENRAEATFFIEDNDEKRLNVTVDKTELVEGESTVVRVTSNSLQDTYVRLQVSGPLVWDGNGVIDQFTRTAELTITAVDDDVPNENYSWHVIAFADDHIPVEFTITVIDNDVPEIEMTLSPTVVNESDGLSAIAGTIRRTSNLENKVRIDLSDNSAGDLFFSTNTIEMDAGVEEAHFTIGVIDNAVVDGDRTVTVTAAVYLVGCGCSATTPGRGMVTADVTIFDNDGPALSMTTDTPTVREGEQFTLRIGRNTESLEVVTAEISCDTEGFVFPDKVEIPSGQAYVDVPVSVDPNDVEDDSRTAVFTVRSEGYSSATCYVMVTDRTLPDAVIKNVALTGADSFITGDKATVEVRIENAGVTALAPGTIDVYVGSDIRTTLYFHDPIAPGEGVTLSREVQLPEQVGQCSVRASYNASRTVSELLYTNNELVAVVDLLPSFAASVSADKQVYAKGETVRLSGKVTGRDVAGRTVEVYVINEGLRTTIQPVTEADGSFTCEFNPADRQSGYFIAGACYPGEGSTEAAVEFDVIGLRRTATSQITHQGLVGVAENITVTIANPGRVTVDEVKVEVLESPENYTVAVDAPATIAGDANADLRFTLTANAPTEGSLWQQIPVRVSHSGVTDAEFTLYVFARTEKGALVASESSINGTMTKGSTREYPIVLTNEGAGETGTISLVLPNASWMRAATPVQMPSLAPGESTTVVLSLTPTADMQLNVPATGTIGINCSNGSGLALPFRFEAVSEATGTLVVEVCDEYTYYTKEGPRVEGATVTVTHPVTGAVVAQGTTGTDGVFTVEVPEGYYAMTVTEDGHGSYKADAMLINPGRENLQVVNLSIDAIKISYDIVETEIEDEYRVVTTVTYETNVPKAIVTVEGPEGMVGEDMNPGDSKIVNLVMTNRGLITALNTTMAMPEDDEEWSFEALVDLTPFDLAPQQARVIPVRITRHALPAYAAPRYNMNNPLGRCMASYEYWYQSQCGKVLGSNPGAYNMALKACAWGLLGQAIMDAVSNLGIGGPSFTSGPAGGGGGGYGSTYSPPAVTETRPAICDPELAARADGILDDLASRVPGVGPIIGTLNSGMNYLNDPSLGNLVDVGANLFGPALDAAGDAAADFIRDNFPNGEALTLAGQAAGALNDWYELGEQLGVPRMKAQTSKFSWAEVFDNKAIEYCHYLDDFDQLIRGIFGDPIWFNEYDNEMVAFYNAIAEKNSFDYDVLAPFKPSVVSEAQLRALLARFEAASKGEDVFNRDELLTIANRLLDMENAAVEAGFRSYQDVFQRAYDEYEANIRRESNTVCASVTLQFEQSLFLTRQAFRGTLTVLNGHDSKPMQDVMLNLVVTDEEGVPAASDRFQISLETLKGFGGKLNLTDGWSLESKATGVATILYIPTKNAAPETDKVYNFSGSITYLDPYTDLVVTRELKPVSLTVKPSPELDLVYFMQRDVFGDDPLTYDVVEPSTDTEFALLMVNKGAGEAKNVRMTTKQPRIVDNEKGLDIDFEIISAQLNGQEKTLALGETVATEFGTLGAGQSAYAQWWFRCNLLGHFLTYDVTATHVTDYGNPDLSLLDEVTIHELIRSIDVTAGESGMAPVKGWIVNDVTDPNDAPDHIYLSDNTKAELVVLTGSVMRMNDDECEITVSTDDAGWFYVSVPDPAVGRRVVESVIFDGDERPANNAWLTDRTLIDGHDPLYEFRLHTAAYAATAGQHTVRVRFAPAPTVELEVEDFLGVPEVAVQKEAVKDVTVVFNKDIEEATFTSDDISFKLQGESLDASEIKIERIDGRTYKLVLGDLTNEDGYYVLTVATADIIDSEGFNGKNGRSVAWVQAIDGPVTGVDVIDAGEFGLWPVPTRGELNVSAPGASFAPYVIVDMAGKSLREGELGADGTAKLDVADLPEGHYLLMIKHGSSAALRFVKY